MNDEERKQVEQDETNNNKEIGIWTEEGDSMKNWIIFVVIFIAIVSTCHYLF